MNITNKEFYRIVKEYLLKVNKNIKKEDLYCSQVRDGYSVAYFPKYPESTTEDFDVYINIWTGKVTLHGHYEANIPTVKRYKNINDFINGIEED